VSFDISLETQRKGEQLVPLPGPLPPKKFKKPGTKCAGSD
jgi:hypothetical protein